MITLNILKRIYQQGQGLIVSLFLILGITFTWVNISIYFYSTANAATLQSINFIGVIDSIEDADTKGKNLLDKVVGEGTSNQIEGKVDKAVGKTQQELGNIEGQTKGLVKQAKGKVEENIGKVQNTLEKSTAEAQDTYENIVDNIQSFFEK